MILKLIYSHPLRKDTLCPEEGDKVGSHLYQEGDDSLLSPVSEGIVEKHGYIYKKEPLVKNFDVESNKSTQVFKVILSKEQAKSTSEENIGMVGIFSNRV